MIYRFILFRSSIFKTASNFKLCKFMQFMNICFVSTLRNLQLLYFDLNYSVAVSVQHFRIILFGFSANLLFKWVVSRQRHSTLKILTSVQYLFWRNIRPIIHSLELKMPQSMGFARDYRTRIHIVSILCEVYFLVGSLFRLFIGIQCFFCYICAIKMMIICALWDS